MRLLQSDSLSQVLNVLRRIMDGPQMLAFLPAAVLAAFWLGGEGWLLAVALGVPVLHILLPSLPAPELSENETPSGVIEGTLRRCEARKLSAVVFLIELDDYALLLDRHGQFAADHVVGQSSNRLRQALRSGDHVLPIEGGRLCIVTAPERKMDLEAAILIAGRMQQAVEEPITLDSASIYMSCSVGFCLTNRNPGEGAPALYEAAEAALSEARQNAPSAIRAHTRGMQSDRAQRSLLSAEAAEALENGQIRPWFQPQVSTETRQVTGFEALARWVHPERGLISPAEFLPALEEAGLMARLGEIMRREAMKALRAWDAANLGVPAVGVNFSPMELRDPGLVDRIRWELDQFDLEAERLIIEVLETVIAASPDDSVTRNINGLARMGCPIDLDDFGTGHASISSLRRFAARRIKIDRSFVMKVDRDADQQRMVSAILTMAERLDLDTLAEGVETLGEQVMLAQLGCRHVQGFGIGRPMPLEQVPEWMKAYDARREMTPIIRKA